MNKELINDAINYFNSLKNQYGVENAFEDTVCEYPLNEEEIRELMSRLIKKDNTLEKPINNTFIWLKNNF